MMCSCPGSPLSKKHLAMHEKMVRLLFHHHRQKSGFGKREILNGYRIVYERQRVIGERLAKYYNTDYTASPKKKREKREKPAELKDEKYLGKNSRDESKKDITLQSKKLADSCLVAHKHDTQHSSVLVDHKQLDRQNSQFFEEMSPQTRIKESINKTEDLINAKSQENRTNTCKLPHHLSNPLDKQASLSLETVKSKSVDRLHKHLQSSKLRSVDRHYCQNLETQKSKSLDHHLCHKETLKSKFFDRQHSQPLEILKSPYVDGCDSRSTERQISHSIVRQNKKLADRQQPEASDVRCSSEGSSPRWSHRSSSESRSACSSPLCHSPRRLTPDRHESCNGSLSISEDSEYVEEEPEKQLVPGVVVRAATVDKLAALTVDCFDETGQLISGSELPRVLFLMHQWFISSEELAEKFLELYKSCDSQKLNTSPLLQHLQPLNDNIRQIYKTKVCHTLRYWIRTFPVCFDLNRQLSHVIREFEGVIQKDGHSRLDITSVPSYDWMRNMSVRNPSMKHSDKSEKVSLVFNHLQPAELAEHLTYLEYKAFRRITFSDFKNYAVHASLKDNPKLERSIALFNGLSQWIQCMVLSKTTPQERADVIVKFVNVAKHLRELQNFSTLMAVIGGLTHSALARLTKTNACLPAETQKYLNDFSELLSSCNNFSNYRRELQQTQGFRIPVLGVHLKDLILLHTALADKLNNNLVNFRKMAQLSIIFTELMQVQNASLPVEPNMDLANTLRLSLDMHYSEDEIYELSLAREPRNSLSSPSTPTKPVVFADWVAGVSPPDPDTITKHVHDMVEAVFKNYDHDRDGFISHDEFEAIAGNFPFIDSFCVLDADQDGMISKAEMKTYFNRANCHALRNSFKHGFHETTYFKPTFCIHCTGLLWGLIKQGWKCRECGINAHKHCKDLVVMECRSKAHTVIHGRSISLPNGTSHRDVTIASKRKMSQRHRRLLSSRATQTDEQFFSLTVCNSPKIGIASSPKLRHLSSSRLDSSSTRLSSCSSPKTSRSNSPKLSVKDDTYCTIAEEEVFDDSLILTEKLSKSEEIQKKLMLENRQLRNKLETQAEQIGMLKSHIGTIRQHTITFILDQMDTLHIQRDTEV